MNKEELALLELYKFAKKYLMSLKGSSDEEDEKQVMLVDIKDDYDIIFKALNKE